MRRALSTHSRAQSHWCRHCRGRGDSARLASPPPPDLHVLLLEDLLVLLQKQDEKLLLKCHSKTAAGSADSKQTFSPVLKLNAVLVRSVATGAPAGPPAWRCSLGHPPPPVFLRRPAPSTRGGRGGLGEPR